MPRKPEEHKPLAVMATDGAETVIDNPALTVTQKKSIALTAMGYSRPQVARLVGVSYPTIRRWTSEDEYASTLFSVLDEAYSECWQQLKAGYVKALDKTVQHLHSSKESTSLRACELLLKAVNNAQVLQEQRDARKKLDAATLRAERDRLLRELKDGTIDIPHAD